MDKTEFSDAEWRARLTPEQYRVLRKGGTEAPWTGELLRVKGTGTFVCAGCGQPLFDTGAKFESGSGWPSFTEPRVSEAVSEYRDTAHGMIRTEVRCATCEGHLGHVFPDGPGPSGLRYCINSAALEFAPEGEEKGGG